jgi:hypothetical protein
MGQPTSVGRACVMGGSAAATLPNASDCNEGDAGDALAGCQRYGELCEGGGDGTIMPMRDGGSVANDDEGAADAGTALRELQTDGVSAGGSGRGCGCRMAPTTSGPTASGVLLAGLALWAYVRRCRRRQRLDRTRHGSSSRRILLAPGVLDREAAPLEVRHVAGGNSRAVRMGARAGRTRSTPPSPGAAATQNPTDASRPRADPTSAPGASCGSRARLRARPRGPRGRAARGGAPDRPLPLRARLRGRARCGRA